MRGLVVATAAILLGTPRLHGQVEGGQPEQLFLAPDHWAVQAVRRLDDLGLADAGFDAFSASLSRREVEVALDRAAARLERGEGRWLRLIEGYRARFEEEFGRAPGGVPGGRGRLEAAYAGVYGHLLAGREDPADPDGWVEPAALPDRAGIRLGAALDQELTRRTALAASAAWAAGGLRVESAYMAARVGPATLWLGRRSPAVGAGRSGSIVLGGSVPLDGVGVRAVRPIRLPGTARALGPLRFEMLLARLDESGAVRRPWVWVASGSLQPHPRLQVGVSRGAIFGGDGVRVEVIDLLALLAGAHGRGGSERENQIAVVQARFRPPLPLLPLVLKLEWGLEDSAGAWKDVPGIIAGVALPALPGLPQVGAGVEWASFAGSCCGNPPWYRHRVLSDGWADDGRLLGHPLGGHGSERAAFVDLTARQARVRLTAAGFARDRGAENLFSPTRGGRSTGVRMNGHASARPGWELFARGEAERGEAGWSAWEAAAGIRALF